MSGHDDKRLAEVRARLQRLIPLAAYIPHERQAAFHKRQERVRLFLGGNRSGKTLAGAVEAVWYALGVHPYRTVPEPPNYGWVVSLDFPSSRDVAVEKVLKLLPPTLYNWRRSEHILELKNKSVIGFKSCDSGRDKFQGVARHWIWFDEEPPVDIYHECLMRTLDYGGAIWLTMTPMNGISWSYDEIYRAPNVGVVRASILDNPYLPEREREEIINRYNGWERRARVEGEYAMPSGGVVASDLLEQLLPHAWHAGALGSWQVFVEPHASHDYVMGVDVGAGYGESDYSVVDVTDRMTRDTVAQWRGHIDPDLLATQVILPQAERYNKALVIVEVNGVGLATQKALERAGWRRYWVELDTRTDRPRVRRGGFSTSIANKPLLIAALLQTLRDDLPRLPRTLIDELATLSWQSTSNVAASGGGHDDQVMAKALAIYAHMHTWLPRGEQARATKAATLRQSASNNVADVATLLTNEGRYDI